MFKSVDMLPVHCDSSDRETREIGMMRAMGMRRQRVVALIVIESLLVVLFGLAIGYALSLTSLWALSDGIDLSSYAEGLGMFGVGARM